MPGLLHEAAIERLKLLHPNLETKKFRARLLEEMKKTDLCNLLSHDEVDSDPDIDHGCCLECLINELANRVVPDAFMIEQSGEPGNGWQGRITVFEVEDSHNTDAEKIQKYANLFWQVLDPEYWQPILIIIVDRWGNEKPPVCTMEMDFLFKRVKAR